MNAALCAHERLVTKARKDGRLREHIFIGERQLKAESNYKRGLRIGKRAFASVSEAMVELQMSGHSVRKLVDSGCGEWI